MNDTVWCAEECSGPGEETRFYVRDAVGAAAVRRVTADSDPLVYESEVPEIQEISPTDERALRILGNPTVQRVMAALGAVYVGER